VVGEGVEGGIDRPWSLVVPPPARHRSPEPLMTAPTVPPGLTS
jgi:hypothetical protein